MVLVPVSQNLNQTIGPKWIRPYAIVTHSLSVLKKYNYETKGITVLENLLSHILSSAGIKAVCRGVALMV